MSNLNSGQVYCFSSYHLVNGDELDASSICTYVEVLHPSAIGEATYQGTVNDGYVRGVTFITLVSSPLPGTLS